MRGCVNLHSAQYFCVIHVRAGHGSSTSIGIIIGVVFSLLFIVILVVAYVSWQSRIEEKQSSHAGACAWYREHMLGPKVTERPKMSADTLGRRILLDGGHNGMLSSSESVCRI